VTISTAIRRPGREAKLSTPLMTKLRTEMKTIKKKYYLSPTLVLPKKKNERQESTNAFFSYSPSFVLNWNIFFVTKIAFQIETRST
jgi:hypothetical protein